MSHKIVFQPSGIKGEVPKGDTLYQAVVVMGLGIESLCGGKGTCGKCRVKVMEGYFNDYDIHSSAENLSPVTAVEENILTALEIEEGFRLACLAEVKGDAVIFIPPEVEKGSQVIVVEGIKRQFHLYPAVESIALELPPADLKDNRGDAERLGDAASEKLGCEVNIDIPVLRELPRLLRENGWNINALTWGGREIIGIAGLNGPPGLFGLAVDIGTTTIAAYLCDLHKGVVKATASAMNPQGAYGEDIISRISYCRNSPRKRRKMRQIVVQAVNRLINDIERETGIGPEKIVDAVLVFNTVMHHLFLGIEPEYLGGSPFVPGCKEALDIKARDIGLDINSSAYVHVLPLIAGYVGADNVAFLIAEEPYKKDAVGLYIDIGTNGEVDLGNKDGLSCTSCATGPALEGAKIKHGMRAAPGAIERVVIDRETYEPSYKVIGKEEWYPELYPTGARGICGSGIVDVVAALYMAGIIGRDGRFKEGLGTPRVRRGSSGSMEYVLAWKEETGLQRDLAVTQWDIRTVQLAKAAIYVSAQVLMEKRNIEEPHTIVLAGAFGNYIDKNNALAIGMFPACPPDRIVSVGNSAGDGACLALFSRRKRAEAREVARSVRFVETALHSSFQDKYLEALSFPEKK